MMQSPRYSENILEKPVGYYPKQTSSTQPLLPMLNNKVLNLTSDTKTFTTIDDLKKLAEELLAGINKLGGYKHPLDVRRGLILKGREEVGDMAYAEESKMVKSSSRTYFFDIKRTQEGKPYLVITESRKKENMRSSIMVFPEDADEFFAALEEMIKKL